MSNPDHDSSSECSVPVKKSSPEEVSPTSGDEKISVGEPLRDLVEELHDEISFIEGRVSDFLSVHEQAVDDLNRFLHESHNLAVTEGLDADLNPLSDATEELIGKEAAEMGTLVTSDLADLPHLGKEFLSNYESVLSLGSENDLVSAAHHVAEVVDGALLDTHINDELQKGLEAGSRLLDQFEDNPFGIGSDLSATLGETLIGDINMETAILPGSLGLDQVQLPLEDISVPVTTSGWTEIASLDWIANDPSITGIAELGASKAVYPWLDARTDFLPHDLAEAVTGLGEHGLLAVSDIGISGSTAILDSGISKTMDELLSPSALPQVLDSLAMTTDVSPADWRDVLREELPSSITASLSQTPAAGVPAAPAAKEKRFYSFLLEWTARAAKRLGVKLTPQQALTLILSMVISLAQISVIIGTSIWTAQKQAASAERNMKHRSKVIRQNTERLIGAIEGDQEGRNYYVITAEVPLRVQPDSTAAVIAELSENNKVIVDKKKGDWHHVLFPDHLAGLTRSGWVKAEATRRIAD